MAKFLREVPNVHSGWTFESEERKGEAADIGFEQHLDCIGPKLAAAMCVFFELFIDPLPSTARIVNTTTTTTFSCPRSDVAWSVPLMVRSYEKQPISLGSVAEWLCRVVPMEGQFVPPASRSIQYCGICVRLTHLFQELAPRKASKHAFHHTIVTLDRELDNAMLQVYRLTNFLRNLGTDFTRIEVPSALYINRVCVCVCPLRSFVLTSLEETLFHLRRAYGQKNRPPPPSGLQLRQFSPSLLIARECDCSASLYLFLLLQSAQMGQVSFPSRE